MESEKLSTCENCERDIAESKLALHEAYCRRNIIRCPKCKAPVDKNEMAAHEEEKHIKKKCPDCGLEMDTNAMQAHPKYCSKKPKDCKFCSLTISAGEYSDHVYTCGSRTKICPTCRKNIILRDFDHHEISCALESSNAPKNFPKLDENKKPTYSVPTNPTNYPVPQNTYQPLNSNAIAGKVSSNSSNTNNLGKANPLTTNSTNIGKTNPVPKQPEEFRAVEQKNRFEPLNDRKSAVEKSAVSGGGYSGSSFNQPSGLGGGFAQPSLGGYNPSIPAGGYSYSNLTNNSINPGMSKPYPSENPAKEISKNIDRTSGSMNYSKPVEQGARMGPVGLKNEVMPRPGSKIYEDNKGLSNGNKPYDVSEAGRGSGTGIYGNQPSQSINKNSYGAENKISDNYPRPGSNSGINKSGPSSNTRVPVSTGINIGNHQRVQKDNGGVSAGSNSLGYKPGVSGVSSNNGNSGKMPPKDNYTGSSTNTKYGYQNQNNSNPVDTKIEDRYKKQQPSSGGVSGGGVYKGREKETRYDEHLAKQLQEEDKKSAIRKPSNGANPSFRHDMQKAEPEFHQFEDFGQDDEELQKALEESIKNKIPSSGVGGYVNHNRPIRSGNLNDTMNDDDFKEAIERSKKNY